MRPGDVVRVVFPQGDGRIKVRPAVLLEKFPPKGDWLVCAVSSKLHMAVPELDVILHTGDKAHAGSGLRADALIRVGMLITLPLELFRGLPVGNVGPAILGLVRTRLSQRFAKTLM